MRYNIIAICLIICTVLISCSEEKRQNTEERPFMQSVDREPSSDNAYFRDDIFAPKEKRNEGAETWIEKSE
ncbi:MAG: hypothetical protein IJP46_07115 [Prevotella sp.]|nr:hypothetical protein [Prevotella sp.]